MLIALDWDDTISNDVEGFREFVSLFRRRGHEFIIVTIRPPSQPNEDVLAFSMKEGIPVIFTNGKQKAAVCKDAGYQVDVWVDDCPVLIPAAKELSGVLHGCFTNNDL
tara:strand:- start:23480 stop:23803 length:324 start_codon:yes stop_codon:yes gene_type:complete